MLNLPRISFSRPTLSLRFFIYFLFGLVVLILAAEGGYYFWVQKGMERQKTKNSFIVRQEGMFTYIKAKGEVDQKQIWGTVEEINGNELTIKTEGDEEVKVKYNNEKIWIAERYVEEAIQTFMTEAGLSALLPGDRVHLSGLETNSQGNLFAGYLVVIR